MVDLGLVLAVDPERDRFIEMEVRSSVQADELLAAEGEVDGQDLALLRARIVGRRAGDAVDPAIGKDRGVELRGLLGLSVVEPEKRVIEVMATPPLWLGRASILAYAGPSIASDVVAAGSQVRCGWAISRDARIATELDYIRPRRGGPSLVFSSVTTLVRWERPI